MIETSNAPHNRKFFEANASHNEKFFQGKEWEILPRDALNPKTIDRLHLLARHSAQRLKKPKDAVFSRIPEGLKAGQIVGILAIPGLTVEILPKIEGEDNNIRSVLVRMLNVAYDLRIADGEIDKLSRQRHDLLEILIRLFANRLLAAVRFGLPRRYLTHHDDLRLLRGKLDVTRQVTRLVVRTDLIACRYDELSPDTPLNRVLKAAVARLSNLSRSLNNIRTLNELKIRFDSVSNSSNPLGERVRLDRTNSAYHDLYRWACLFLEGGYQSTTGGHMSGFSLLFAMNDLFENFIGKSLKSVFAEVPGCEVVPQYDKQYALLYKKKTKIFNLKPDVVIQQNNRPYIVLDTKWKRLELHKDSTKYDIRESDKFDIKESDIYQMIAYAHAYDPSRLVLLYPWHKEIADGAGIFRRWEIDGKNKNYPLDIATVDIGYSKQDRYLEKVREKLREITEIMQVTEIRNGQGSGQTVFVCIGSTDGPGNMYRVDGHSLVATGSSLAAMMKFMPYAHVSITKDMTKAQIEKEYGTIPSKPKSTRAPN